MESTTGYTFTPCVGLLPLGLAWHRQKGPTAFSVSSSERQRFTISNVESHVFTPNNSRLSARGLNPGRRHAKRTSYHWTTALLYPVAVHIYVMQETISYYNANGSNVQSFQVSRFCGRSPDFFDKIMKISRFGMKISRFFCKRLC